MADLGPGTMPRGKYPESPAPAGSHALISRTPTPGGMLHANLGLPRPPPRNFQPPLPQQPSKQTATAPPLNLCRSQAPLGNASREALLRIPAPATALRETHNTSHKPQKQKAILVPSLLRRHACLTTPACEALLRIPAPATALRETHNAPIPQTAKTKTAAIKPVSFPSSAWECVPRSSARIPAPATALRETHNTSHKPQKQKPPRAALPRRHACLTTPVANTCSRNSSQSNRKRIPPHRHSGISAARRACLPIGENAKRRFAGHSAAARMKQFPAVVFRHGCRRASGPERRPHSRRTRGQLL